MQPGDDADRPLPSVNRLAGGDSNCQPASAENLAALFPVAPWFNGPIIGVANNALPSGWSVSQRACDADMIALQGSVGADLSLVDSSQANVVANMDQNQKLGSDKKVHALREAFRKKVIKSADMLTLQGSQTLSLGLHSASDMETPTHLSQLGEQPTV